MDILCETKTEGLTELGRCDVEDGSGTLVVEPAQVAESESFLKEVLTLRFCPTWRLRQRPGVPMRHGPMRLK